MEQTFMTGLRINKVRHLRDVEIPLSTETRKHLILTGKNGSGKTSVFESLSRFVQFIVSSDFKTKDQIQKTIDSFVRKINQYDDSEVGRLNKAQDQKTLEFVQKKLLNWSECEVQCTSFAQFREKYQAGRFILAAYGATRTVLFNAYKDITMVDLKPVYSLNDNPAKDFGKYMASQKARRSFARDEGNEELSTSIADWFDRLEGILRRIYGDDSLRLDFDHMTFQFSLHMDNREPFTFNTMSLGYSAIFDIVSDLMMRMESQHRYDLEGIVLIDEVEAHLHVELQRQIVPILTELFPNIQFIMTTHSPFVLSSAKNAVIYDLENGTLVEDGLTGLPYEGVVKSYFDTDLYSVELRGKFEEYKKLIQSPTLSDADYARLDALEMYLDDVPSYLAAGLKSEYLRLKLDFDATH